MASMAPRKSIWTPDALTVSGAQFSDEAVKAAVAEAGYEVIS